MPYKPKHKCNIPWCNNLVLTRHTYCYKHRKEKANHYAQNPSKGYTSNEIYDHRWKKLRRLILRKSPFCVECLKQNKYIPASEVDHIIPHKGDKTNFYNEDNLQTLCKHCHSKKTVRETNEPLH